MLWKMKLKLDISLWHSSNEVHCNSMQQYLGASRGVCDTVIVWMDIHSEGGLSHPTIHQGTALDIAQSALDILHRKHNPQKFKAQARKLPSIALENIDPRAALRVQNSQMQVSPKGKLPTTQN